MQRPLPVPRRAGRASDRVDVRLRLDPRDLVLDLLVDSIAPVRCSRRASLCRRAVVLPLLLVLAAAAEAAPTTRATRTSAQRGHDRRRHGDWRRRREADRSSSRPRHLREDRVEGRSTKGPGNGPTRSRQLRGHHRLSRRQRQRRRRDRARRTSDEGQPRDLRGSSQVDPRLRDRPEGAHAGDRVLITISSKDGFDPTGNRTAPSRRTTASSSSSTCSTWPHRCPRPRARRSLHPPTSRRSQLDKDGHPTKFKATKTTPKTVDELGVYTVIEGTGPTVEVRPDASPSTTSASSTPTARSSTSRGSAQPATVPDRHRRRHQGLGRRGSSARRSGRG